MTEMARSPSMVACDNDYSNAQHRINTATEDSCYQLECAAVGG
eukprot:COSAG01_NODE_40882_length_458_cov_1.490251_1_plen_42_part_10